MRCLPEKLDRVRRFWELAVDRPIHALRLTATGAPGHPLYIPADQPLQPYHPEETP